MDAVPSATTSGPATPLGPTQPPAASSAFELDLVYPRNETYKYTDKLPIVFALQNARAAAAAAGASGAVRLLWDIMPWGDGNQPGGIVVEGNGGGEAYYRMQDLTTDQPLFYVNVTNTTQWRFTGPVFCLQWSVDLFFNNETYNNSSCNVVGAINRTFFSVTNRDPAAVVADIMSVPECPTLLARAEFDGDATTTAPSSTCPAVQTETSTGNPCAVTVDKARASLISSMVSEFATPTTTMAVPPPYTSVAKHNSGGGLRPRIVRVLVVVGMVQALGLLFK